MNRTFRSTLVATAIAAAFLGGGLTYTALAGGSDTHGVVTVVPAAGSEDVDVAATESHAPTEIPAPEETTAPAPAPAERVTQSPSPVKVDHKTAATTDTSDDTTVEEPKPQDDKDTDVADPTPSKPFPSSPIVVKPPVAGADVHGKSASTPNGPQPTTSTLTPAGQQ